jgi:hypothetical protein
MRSPDWPTRDEAEVERLARTLEPRARALFAFLRREAGFTQRPSARRQRTLWTRLIYRGADLGIEIELNYHLRLVVVWLVRLEQGGYPKRAGVDAGPVDGVLIRPRLERVLRDHLHIADATLDELDRLRRDSEREERDEAFLTHMLDLYHRLLLHHLATVLDQPLDRLFPSGVPDRRVQLPEIQRELERQAQERLDFLREEYGFFLHIPSDWVWGASFRYLGRQIGVEVAFDYREGTIGVDLAELYDGLPLPAVLKWERGMLVLARLERVVEDSLGAPDPVVGELRRAFTNTDWSERDLAFCASVLEKYQRLLHSHIGEILRQPLDVVFPRARTGTP